MNLDNYTKSILTVIAICLVVLTLNQVNVFPTAHAAIDENPMIPSARNYGLVPLNENGSVSVSVDNLDEVKVNIVGISTHDKLDVNLDEIGGGFLSSGGPIKVKVD